MRLRSTGSFPLFLGILAALATTPFATAQIPNIDPRSTEPIDLIFEEPVSVIDAYRALGKAWGINFLFDPKLRDHKLSIVLENVTPLHGLENLLRSANHFYTVVDPQTLLIADDTPQNRRTYESQVIQTFRLANGEVKDAMTMLRSLLGLKHVSANLENNSLVVRDTADKVLVAEKILRRNDQPKGEIVLEVDLLTIKREDLQGLALQPATDSPVAAPGEAPARLATGEIERLRSESSTRALAQPKLNILAGSPGKMRLSDRLRLPNEPSSTASAGQDSPFINQEVGLTLEVQPRVHSAADVSLKLTVEVDTLTDWMSRAGEPEQPIFGRRSFESSLRLRDGETYLLTGLMIAPESATQGTQRASKQFGSFLQSSAGGREVVLGLTPRIVRGPGFEGDAQEPLWVGTEAAINLAGSGTRVTARGAGPFGIEEAPLAAADREKLRERLRERLQEQKESATDQ